MQRLDFSMPQDQDGCPVSSVIPASHLRLDRYRAFSNSCCMRVASFFVTVISLSLIITHITWYTLYFHAWNDTLVDFEQKHPGNVDLAFLRNVTWILVPLEACTLTTAVGAIVWVVEKIAKKLGLSHRGRLVLAILKASILFGAFNIGAYTFHQFTIKKILTCQTDLNTTHRLFQQVSTKLWEM